MTPLSAHRHTEPKTFYSTHLKSGGAPVQQLDNGKSCFELEQFPSIFRKSLT